MRMRPTLLALLLGTGMAQAQVVSPLGGSTTNPQSTRPPAAAIPARPAPVAPSPSPSTAPAPATTTPTTTPAAGAPATATAPTRTRRTLDERFGLANTTHDGKLTLEQARAGRMRTVVRDFALIDTAKQGYVTVDQIKAYRAAHRTHRAPRQPAAAPTQ